MCLYIEIFGKRIPSYGLLIVIGIVLANIIAYKLIPKKKHDINDFIIIEAYTFLGAFIGAKLLYLFVSYQEIEWHKVLDYHYLNQLMRGGFVFYGGLLGGLFSSLLAGKIHKLQVPNYIRSYIFLIPFIHAFGRIGCFLAGCCYGIPYDGLGAIIYPKESLAPSGIYLFPVQLLEAVLLLFISITIVILQEKYHWYYTIETYFIGYAIIRFILEYFRYDDIRGIIGDISTSQLLSLIIIVAIIAFRFIGKHNSKSLHPKT